jgi:hypothetical protein
MLKDCVGLEQGRLQLDGVVIWRIGPEGSECTIEDLCIFAVHECKSYYAALGSQRGGVSSMLDAFAAGLPEEYSWDQTVPMIRFRWRNSMHSSTADSRTYSDEFIS